MGASCCPCNDAVRSDDFEMTVPVGPPQSLVPLAHKGIARAAAGAASAAVSQLLLGNVAGLQQPRALPYSCDAAEADSRSKY
mmetsp:Transcript_69252/g.225583  ORF Transcript_69252/g.225583 Transcript_69252/m.225583 type:complete len:82 (-) Transcript_69252:180-425(-)